MGEKTNDGKKNCVESQKIMLTRGHAWVIVDVHFNYECLDLRQK